MTKKLQRLDKMLTKRRAREESSEAKEASKLAGEMFGESNHALCKWNKTKKAMKLSTAGDVVCGYNA